MSHKKRGGGGGGGGGCGLNVDKDEDVVRSVCKNQLVTPPRPAPHCGEGLVPRPAHAPQK